MAGMENVRGPGQTIANVADDVEAGLKVELGALSGKPRSAEWLRAVHEKLLKRVVLYGEDTSLDDPSVLGSNLPGGDRVIADRMLVRSAKDGDHVLLMGSVIMMLDPLCCPYACVGQCPDGFCYFKCDDMKTHLENVHHLNNVRINLLCPSSGETDCRDIAYDPQGIVVGCHVKKAHPDFADEIVLGLCYGYDQTDAGSAAHKLYRTKLPPWLLETDKLPSQEIICRSPLIKDKKLQYKCNQPRCMAAVFTTVAELFLHLLKSHKISVGQTWTTSEIYFPPECLALYPLIIATHHEGDVNDFYLIILLMVMDGCCGHPAFTLGTQFRYNAKTTRKVDLGITVLMTVGGKPVRLPVLLHEGKGGKVFTGKAEMDAVKDTGSRNKAMEQLWDRTWDAELLNLLLIARRSNVILVSTLGGDVMIWRWEIKQRKVILLTPDPCNARLVEEHILTAEKNGYPPADPWMWFSVFHPLFRRTMTHLRDELGLEAASFPIVPPVVPVDLAVWTARSATPAVPHTPWKSRLRKRSG